MLSFKRLEPSDLSLTATSFVENTVDLFAVDCIKSTFIQFTIRSEGVADMFHNINRNILGGIRYAGLTPYL